MLGQQGEEAREVRLCMAMHPLHPLHTPSCLQKLLTINPISFETPLTGGFTPQMTKSAMSAMIRFDSCPAVLNWFFLFLLALALVVRSNQVDPYLQHYLAWQVVRQALTRTKN